MVARPIDAISSLTVATGAAAITPSDSGVHPYRALYVGATGNLSLVMADGSAAIFTNVPVGIWDFAIQRVNATSTTATGIVGLL